MQVRTTSSHGRCHQFLAEKISALMTEEYLEKRAQRGDRKKFRRALAKVADVAPAARDRLK